MRIELILLALIFLSCQNKTSDNSSRLELVPEPDKELRLEYEKNVKNSEMQNIDLEELAFEGINIDFRFIEDKPTFGDLFLICGYGNPNFPANSKEFENLNNLGFEQVDDYFGVRNTEELGDDVSLWLFPLIGDAEVHHNEGPFDALRIHYTPIRNESKKIQLIERVFDSIKSNLEIEIYFENQKISNFENIADRLNQINEFCKNELNVQPGSDEALQLDW